MSNAASTLTHDAASIASCNHLLIVAAAGLSIADSLPNNVYHSRQHFATQYPCIARYGYGTSYEAMGLFGDASVPEAARVAYTSHHFMNMGFLFPPTAAYAWLLELQRSFPAQNTFIWTSNIDRCFARAGFDAERVYATQGECNRMQCPSCSNIWDCEEQMREVVKSCVGIDWENFDLSKRPHCPKCKGTRILPNLRGGDWFNPSPYAATGARLQSYLDSIVDGADSVAVLEIGVGPNTPVVTRYPASYFANAVVAAGGRCTYFRLNPDRESPSPHDPQPPVSFFKRQVGWQERSGEWAGLQALCDEVVRLRKLQGQQQQKEQKNPDRHHDLQQQQQWRAKYSKLLESLRRPPF